MGKPICVGCRVEYRCDKNEVWVNDPKSGNFPATYWSADRWVCPGCFHMLIVGRGHSKVFESGKEPDDSLEFSHNLRNENEC